MNKEICIPLPDERENLFRHLHSTIPRLKPIRDCVSGKLGTIGGLGFKSKHSVSEAERLGLDFVSQGSQCPALLLQRDPVWFASLPWECLKPLGMVEAKRLHLSLSSLNVGYFNMEDGQPQCCVCVSI